MQSTPLSCALLETWALSLLIDWIEIEPWEKFKKEKNKLHKRGLGKLRAMVRHWPVRSIAMPCHAMRALALRGAAAAQSGRSPWKSIGLAKLTVRPDDVTVPAESWGREETRKGDHRETRTKINGTGKGTCGWWKAKHTSSTRCSSRMGASRGSRKIGCFLLLLAPMQVRCTVGIPQLEVPSLAPRRPAASQSRPGIFAQKSTQSNR